MHDLDTEKVVLNKVIRRKTFVLNDAALLDTGVVELDDGTVRYVSTRRPDYFLPERPLVVSFKAGYAQTFDEAVVFLRKFEGSRIIAEL